MKTTELGIIAVKITGLICLLAAVLKIDQVIIMLYQYTVMQEMQNHSVFILFLMLLPFVFYLILGLFLLTAGGRLGMYITRDESEFPVLPGESTILQIAVTIIGIWLMAAAVPKLINSVITAILFTGLSDQTLKLHYLPGLIAYSVQFIIGAWMFLGGRGIMGIRNSIRYAGIKKNDRTDLTRNDTWQKG